MTKRRRNPFRQIIILAGSIFGGKSIGGKYFGGLFLIQFLDLLLFPKS